MNYLLATNVTNINNIAIMILDHQTTNHDPRWSQRWPIPPITIIDDQQCASSSVRWPSLMIINWRSRSLQLIIRWTVCLSLSTTLSLWSIIRPLIFSLCRWYHDNHVLRWTVCPFLGRSPPYSQGWLAFISRFNFFLPLYPGFIFCCLYISSFDFLLAFTSRFFFLAFISRFDFFLAIISRFNFLP